MPSIASVVNKFAKITMVYWRKTGSDSSGRPMFADPVELKVRWEDTQEENIEAGGRVVTASTYLLLSTPVTEGSWVFRGTLVSWKALPTFPKVPTFGQGGREIIKVKETPDIKCKTFIYEAWLSKG